jgi:glutathione S-transferase
LDVAEKQLADTPYIVGSNFSGADILLVSCLDWAVFYGFDLPASVQSYHARVTDREAYQAAFALNFPAHILEALAAGRTDDAS